MKLKIAKIVRIITVAPLMALLALCTLFLCVPTVFGGKLLPFVLSILFLTVLPLLAYPLQPVMPYFKNRGREGQRSLAMIFAVSGYILGCIANLFVGHAVQLWIVYLVYLLSGMSILVLNKVFHLRASAHACGVAGPAIMLAYFGVPWALVVGIIFYAAAFISSVVMKRHTWQQFIGGTLIPMAVLVILHLLFYVI